MKKLIIAISALISLSAVDINAMDAFTTVITESMANKLSMVYNGSVEIEDSTKTYNEYILPMIAAAKNACVEFDSGRMQNGTLVDELNDYSKVALYMEEHGVYLSEFIYNHFCIIVNFFELYNQKVEQMDDSIEKKHEYISDNASVIAVLHEAESNEELRLWISGALKRDVNMFFHFLEDLKSQKSMDIFFSLFVASQISDEKPTQHKPYFSFLLANESARDRYLRNFNSIYGNFDCDEYYNSTVRYNNQRTRAEFAKGEIWIGGVPDPGDSVYSVSHYGDINIRTGLSDFINICGERAKSILFHGEIAVNRFSQISLLAEHNFVNNEMARNFYRFMSLYDLNSVMDLLYVKEREDTTIMRRFDRLDAFPGNFISIVSKTMDGTYGDTMTYVMQSRNMRRALQSVLIIPDSASKLDDFFDMAKIAIDGANGSADKLDELFSFIYQEVCEAIHNLKKSDGPFWNFDRSSNVYPWEKNIELNLNPCRESLLLKLQEKGQ